jgi:hypothetical protein
VCREGVAAQVDETSSPHGVSSRRELARLDAAIALLRSAVARADRVLDGARADLRDREGDLILLRAAADASRMDRLLAGTVGDPSLWYTRIARAREFLRSTLPNGEERETGLEMSGSP